MCAGPNSGSGSGGASGRRLVTEFPPHIQQLLDQQDRMGGSPLRRPMYRKVVTGGSGAPPLQYDGPLPAYLLPGVIQIPMQPVLHPMVFTALDKAP